MKRYSGLHNRLCTIENIEVADDNARKNKNKKYGINKHDRIAHHAIMNITKDIWTKSFIHNTYSCIEGRGIHLCAKDLKRDLRKYPNETTYCLKLDIKKFYPSIPHD